VDINKNLEAVMDKVAKASLRCGRAPEDISIMGVIKNVSDSDVICAIESGIKIVGESKVQEASNRTFLQELKRLGVKNHFIGHLQTNKINQALKIFDLIESVDSYALAEAINKRTETPVEVFLEVNTSGEDTKFGLKPEKTLTALKEISMLKNIKISGLMTIGAFSKNNDKIRKCFRILREIRDEANVLGFENVEFLSMGMSNDFEVAIEEGSDIIRVGTYLFGDRKIKGGK